MNDKEEREEGPTNPEPGVGTSEEKDELVKLSRYLEQNDKVDRGVLQIFMDKSRLLAQKKRKTAAEKEWVQDYLMNHENLMNKFERAEIRKLEELEFAYENEEISEFYDKSTPRKSYVRRREREQVTTPPLSQVTSKEGLIVESPIKKKNDKPATIKLNQLVRTPETFCGYKPPPRKWLDDYERAAEANGWSDEAKLTYFSTFLEKTAQDWFVTIARRKIDKESSWSVLRAAFIRHYLGETDKHSIQRQIDRATQGVNERAILFIPRIVRLFDLCAPGKPEDEIVECIKQKLRQEYQDRLTLHSTYTIEMLNDACLKIEAHLDSKKPTKFESYRGRGRRGRGGGRDAEMRNEEGCQDSYRVGRGRYKNVSRGTSRGYGRGGRRSAYRGSSRNRGYSRNGPEESKNDNDRCYRCQRKGHRAYDCFATTKEDGSPLEPRTPQPRQVYNLTTEEPTNPKENIQVEQPVLPQRTTNTVVSRIRSAGAHINTIINSVKSRENNLIYQLVKFRGVDLMSLIDSGAAVSVLNYDEVKQQGWPIKESKTKLIHAAGENLDVVGKIQGELVFTIGDKSMVTTAEFLVVRGLCIPMLMGIGLLRQLKIQMDFSRKNPISFPKYLFKKGLRCKEEVVVPARTMMFVDVSVNTSSKMIATTSFHFDNAIQVANSVSEVSDGVTQVLVSNVDTWGIRLKKGQQIASFHPFEDRNQAQASLQLNAVLELEDTAEMVKVGDNLNQMQIEQLSKVLSANLEAFSIKGSIGLSERVEHDILLEPNSYPFREKSRRHPLQHVEEAKRQVEIMLKEGVIERSQSPWCSEYVIVRKKTGEWRVCIDFRRLNAMTVKDAYPLPNIEECLEQLSGNVYFSQLDFASGYWQLPVAKRARELTAFRVNGEMFQFKRMPFGLTNAPATFQRLINALFAGLKGMNLQVFLDDVCIASRTWEEHLDFINEILRIVRGAKLKLKGSKCVFGATSVTFLGHLVSKEGVRPDPQKLKAFVELPPPNDVSGVKRILGAFGYYRKFIPSFASVVEPLSCLLRKNKKFDWGAKEENAFKKIKELLASCATLVHLNATDPVMLKTDASYIGIAGILMQEQQGDWRIVACTSRHLKPAEKNYPVMELEMLAVVYSLSKLRHYLLGRRFVVLTDHCALCCLNNKTPHNSRVERWAICLSEYDCKIVHQKGSCHQDVDLISRAPVDTAQDDFLEFIMNANLRLSRRTREVCAVKMSPLNPDEWIDCYEDVESVEILKMAREGVNGFHLKGEIIYKNEALYVPPHFREDILRDNHSSELAAHDGVEGTLCRMKGLFWPEMREDVQALIRNCEVCQKRKVPRRKQGGKLSEHESFRPFEVIAFDYLGPLPETVSRKKFVVVAVDHFTRFVDAKALKDQTAERFLKYFVQLIARFGIPKIIVTDNAKTFDNRSLDCVKAQMNIKHIFSVPGHSQGNAICERTIQSLSDKISLLVTDPAKSLEWDAAVPLATLSLNTKTHSSTGYAPFELLYGREPPRMQRCVERNVTAYDLHSQVIKATLENISAEAIGNSHQAHVDAEKRNNSDPNISFEVGEKVLIKVKSRSAKLAPKYEGPYEVTAKDKDVYEMRKVDQATDRRRRHVSQMKKFHTVLAIISIWMQFVVSIAVMPLQETPPIFWQEETEQYVSEGTESLPYIFHFCSPCRSVLEYARFIDEHRPQVKAILPQPTNNNLQPEVLRTAPNNQRVQMAPQILQLPPQIPIQLAPPQPPMVYPAQVMPEEQLEDPPNDKGEIWMSKEELDTARERRPKREPLMNFVQNLYLSCEQTFNQTIVTSLDGFHFNAPGQSQIRLKRQAAFLAGMIVSSIIGNVKHRWFNTKDDRDWQRAIAASIEQLNHRDVMLAAALKATNSNFNILQQQITNLQFDLNILPSLQTYVDYLVAMMTTKQALLKNLLENIKQGKSDTVTIAELFETEEFEGMNVQDVAIISHRLLRRSTVEFTVFGHVRSKTCKIYVVKHLDYYSNVTGIPVRNEYVGKTHLIKNFTSNCVAAVNPSNQPQVEGDCLEVGKRDPQLKLWRQTPTPNIKSERRHSQYLIAWPNFIIYCWGNNISIAEMGSNQFETTICPTYSFLLSGNYSFETSDQLVRHTSHKTRIQDSHINLVFDVSNVHFDKYLTAHEVYEKNIHDIDVFIREANANTIAVVGGQPITWKSTTLASLTSIALFVVICMIVYCYSKCKALLQQPRCYFSNWRPTQPEIRRQVQQEVKRQVTDQAQRFMRQQRAMIELNTGRQGTRKPVRHQHRMQIHEVI